MAKIVKLHTQDGDLYEIEDQIVNVCTTVKNMLKGKTAFRNSLGGQFSIEGSFVILKKEGRVLATLVKHTEEEAIVSLPDVKSSTLEKVIEYCRFHGNPNVTEREKKIWDSEFVQVKQSVLCELASASYYLDIKPLVNLTSRAIATQLSGKTSEEIRETFCNINCEVYAPFFGNLATRCRLQRKVSKKKQITEGKENGKVSPPLEDYRSVDELLEFIGEAPSKSAKSKDAGDSENSSKKKKKKKKDKKKANNGETRTDANSINEEPQNTEENEDEQSNSPHSTIEIENFPKDEASEENHENENEEDDFDPQLQADIDKEVEEFRQRLESMSRQQRKKIPLPVSAASFVSSLVGVH